MSEVEKQSVPGPRLLISGGPGSGCTSTALAVGERLGLPVFDSDAFFHKVTDPPFQEQYSPEERRALLEEKLKNASGWILSGSVATWGMDRETLRPTHGVFLHVPKSARLARLTARQRKQFGEKIAPGGPLHAEHESFLEWAAGYEERKELGRNFTTDHVFVVASCPSFLELTGDEPLTEVVEKVVCLLGSGVGP